MASIIQGTPHTARHFVLIELKYDEDITWAEAGYESNYDEMIAWCSKNISNKWYSSKMKREIRRGGSLAIFNFEDFNDKAHFVLKWL